MSSNEVLEPISVLPDRFAVAPFSRAEKKAILGPHKIEHEMATASFNWIAAYLCEEIGYFEDEVVDWFRSEARGLYGESPLSIWPTEEGPLTVFEYAQESKQAIDEDLADDPEEHWQTRSHRLGNNAIDIVQRGFIVAGMGDVAPFTARSDFVESHTIHNPAKGSTLTARWKGNRQMEDYKITINDGPRTSSYFVVRYMPPDSGPVILQTGIGRSLEGEEGMEGYEVDTDIDGRPPSIGEVASFVIPLASEVSKGSLAVMRP